MMHYLGVWVPLPSKAMAGGANLPRLPHPNPSPEGEGFIVGFAGATLTPMGSGGVATGASLPRASGGQDVVVCRVIACTRSA